MSDTSGLFRRLATGLGERLEATAARSPRVHVRPPRIDAYHGYASTSEAFISGRLLRNAPVSAADPADPWWRNLVNTYRRMETEKTPGLRLRIELAAQVVESVSDDEGHFRARIRLPRPLPGDRRWHDAEISLIAPPGLGWPAVRAAAAVLRPADDAAFAVLSDVDDTVIETHATRPVRMMRALLFENATTRRPFPGVREFYSRLERGSPGRGPSPLFYLSSSPWNLHGALVEIFEHHGIPVGPLLLRDWGLPDPGEPRQGHREHKLARIEHLLHTYADLPFVLIGDNGQADPEIYEEAVRQHAGRIAAVYVRQVETDDRRRDVVERTARTLAGRGVPFLCFRETGQAMAHAAAHGLIAGTPGDAEEG